MSRLGLRRRGCLVRTRRNICPVAAPALIPLTCVSWSPSGGRVIRWVADPGRCHPGKMISMTVVYLIQHGDKQPGSGDPGLTGLGRMQATRTGLWLDGLGIGALWTSPTRRARETAECIAAVTGLAIHADARLRERLNWDGSTSWEAFADLWARTLKDRDLVSGGGQSARQAGARLQAFLVGLRSLPGPVAAVTHGGVTAELLRTLLGEDALPPGMLAAGIPPCAITTMDDLNPVMIASVSHLR